MTDIRFLASAEIDGVATPAEYVAAVREGYREYGSGAPAAPRTKLECDEPPGMLTGYMAMLPESGAMGGYTYAAGFGDRDAHFLLPVFDPDSGAPIALLDGASLNPLKTGATGAVAVDELARTDASELGLIGSGAQAAGQLRTTATVRNLDRVAVYSPTPDHRKSFAREMDDRFDATVRAVDSAAAAVDGVDIVVTATRAREPVFDGEDLAPGTHVTAMGQYDPDCREIDATTVARSTYVPDMRARIDRDAGAYLGALADGAIDEGHVHADLGDVVAGAAPGRQSDEEITVFDSGGTGIETVAAAAMLVEKATDRNLGTIIDLAPASEALTGR
ncbi:MAG: ornithine cyclodeaminase family protein [Salinirussus sp.]